MSGFAGNPVHGGHTRELVCGPRSSCLLQTSLTRKSWCFLVHHELLGSILRVLSQEQEEACDSTDTALVMDTLPPSTASRSPCSQLQGSSPLDPQNNALPAAPPSTFILDGGSPSTAYVTLAHVPRRQRQDRLSTCSGAPTPCMCPACVCLFYFSLIRYSRLIESR